MNEYLVTFCFTVEAQAAADNVHEFTIPRQMTIVGISLCAEAFTGSPTGFSIDVVDDGSHVISAVAANTAGTPGTWLSKHYGGSNDPVAIAASSVVGVDVNFTGGTSPTADYTLIIWALMGE